MNRRIPNGTYGGVRGRGLITRPYSIRVSISLSERMDCLMDTRHVIAAIQTLEQQHRDLETRCAWMGQELARLQAQWPIVATESVPLLRDVLRQRVDRWLAAYPEFAPVRPALFNAGYRDLFQTCQIPELKVLPVSQVTTAVAFLEAWTPHFGRLWILLLRQTIRDRIHRALKARRLSPDAAHLAKARAALWSVVGPAKINPPADTLSRQRLLSRLAHAPVIPAKAAKTAAQSS
jgi:hypothetical protein